MKHFILFFIIGIACNVNITNAETNAFWSGGVGLKERLEIPPGNLHIILAISSGAYLAYIKVRIENNQGEQVLALTSDGPWVCGDLPEGSYKVIAQRPETGETQSFRFDTIANQRRTVNLVFQNLLDND